MQLFLTYITGRKCHPKLMPPLSPDLQVTFAQLIPALQGWRAFTDSFLQDSQLWKYVAEADTLITNEDIRNLRTSKPYVEVPESSKRQRRLPNSASCSSPLPGTICCATWHWPQPQDPAPSTTSWSQIMTPPGLVRQTELSSCLSTRETRTAPAMLGMNPKTQAGMTALYS